MDETTPLPGGRGRRMLADRYELRGLLGQGGMADVELAYDHVLDRHVAIKLLHQRYTADPAFVTRFRREAQSAAGLNHPNIVAVYDTGEHDGRPFIVMEYVAGRSLAEVVRDEGVLPERATEIAAEAAGALHYAHERGLVHRDVKPGNILLSDDGRVKVADFGIARAVSAETVTQTATVFGTAAYIAPEQAQGTEVDRRTDVYALGCVLYEMLTGRQPFTGDNAVSLAYKHVSQPPTPPQDLNPEIPSELAAVVLQAMAKDPAHRYQSGRQLQTDLQRALHGVPVSAVPTQLYQPTQAAPPTAAMPSSQRTEEGVYEEEQAPRRSPLPWVILAIVLLAVAVVALLLAGVFDREPEVQQVEVPRVLGQSLAEAERTVEDAGLEPRPVPQEDAVASPGTVFDTNPKPGEVVEQSSEVVLFYRPERKIVVVPDLSRLPEDEVQATLERQGLVIGTRHTEPSTEIEEGQVIRTDPAADAQVEEGTQVAYYVSTGPPTLMLPDVRGLSRDAARQELETFCDASPCVQVTVTEEEDGAVPPGAAVRTSPPAGSQVRHGDEVTLYVRPEEPEEEPTTPPPTTPPPTTPPPTTPPEDDPTDDPTLFP